MKQPPTLLQEVEQFIYSYAQNLPNRKLLVDIVRKWEWAYQARIAELEKPATASAEVNRMASEGGASKPDRICECSAVRRPPCSFCTMTEEEYEHYEMRGSRYGGG